MIRASWKLFIFLSFLNPDIPGLLTHLKPADTSERDGDADTELGLGLGWGLVGMVRVYGRSWVMHYVPCIMKAPTKIEI